MSLMALQMSGQPKLKNISRKKAEEKQIPQEKRA
jgi:hypothetical protein